MATGYGWVITRDLLCGTNEEDDHNPFRDDTGVVGPRDSPFTAEQIKSHDNAMRFRMLDDDGVVYYEGLLAESVPSSVDGFEPLDDFGMGNAGATIIQYWNPHTEEWEAL